LYDLLQNNQEFDLIIHDAAHTLEGTGLFFYLSERVLAPGGFMYFDDLSWNIAEQPHIMESAWAKTLSHRQTHTPQVGMVFSGLVGTHPNIAHTYTVGIDNYAWGVCQKKWNIVDAFRKLFPHARVM
jgi:predicted O-methyltransferase YrrM